MCTVYIFVCHPLAFTLAIAQLHVGLADVAPSDTPLLQVGLADRQLLVVVRNRSGRVADELRIKR